jgi:hypothetical protein
MSFHASSEFKFKRPSVPACDSSRLKALKGKRSRCTLPLSRERNMETPLEFVVFYENYTKRPETFIFYLQWTGNEEQLTKLSRFTSKASYADWGPEESKVWIDIATKIPESAVDVHCKVGSMNDYHEMFSKCTGKFTCPFDEEDLLELDECELGHLMNETFHACRIQKFFKKTAP